MPRMTQLRLPLTPQYLISFRLVFFPLETPLVWPFPLIAPKIIIISFHFISCASGVSALHFLYVIWSRFRQDQVNGPMGRDNKEKKRAHTCTGGG